MIECDVDESVPLPTGRANYIDVREKAKAACNSAEFLMKEGLRQTIFDEPDKEEIRKAASMMLRNIAQSNTAVYPEAATTPASILYVNELLSQYDKEVVRDAKRLRMYITNKLIIESDNNDPKVRIKALELLGKISDVGLFTERSEVTINNKSTIELENTLKDKIRKLMGMEGVEDATVIDGDDVDSAEGQEYPDYSQLPEAPNVPLDVKSMVAGL
jgi:hypothetical protein